jgi:hypothetical protein
MKRNLAIALPGITLFALLAISAQSIAQDQAGLPQPQKHHTHYEVVETGRLTVRTAI